MMATRSLVVGLDFRVFLEHVKMQEPAPGRNVVAMEPWSHLLEVVDLLERERLVCWVKARQIGASWLLAAYVDWMLQFRQGARVAMLSEGQLEAKELLGKVRFVHEHLPEGLRLPLGVDNTEELTVPVSEGRVRAFPSTAGAGRGETFSLVVFDEADHHPYFTESYAAVKPTVDDVGGQIVVVSTASAKTVQSTFKDLVRRAPGNGFRAIFYGWDIRPGRDAGWYAAAKAAATDLYLFEKENPRTLEEALAPPQTLMAFDLEVLQAMELDVKDPVETRGTAKIWQKYQPGTVYVAGTDTSHGLGQDEAVTVVKNVATGYIVADIQSAYLSPSTLADDSVKLLEYYGNPLWGIEDNDWGILTLDVAKRMGYPNLYYRTPREIRPHGTATEGIVGFHTGPGISGTRVILWGELIEAVRARLLVIPSKEGLAQFFTVIRNPAKDGKIEAIQGGHDDYPMAVGIAGQVQKSARVVFRRRRGRPVTLPKEW